MQTGRVKETLERILGDHGVEGFGLEGQWALKVVSSGISIGMAVPGTFAMGFIRNLSGSGSPRHRTGARSVGRPLALINPFSFPRPLVKLNGLCLNNRRG
jgi:hypothetical protein